MKRIFLLMIFFYVACNAEQIRNPFNYKPDENVIAQAFFCDDDTRLIAIQEGNETKIITRAKKSPST